MELLIAAFSILWIVAIVSLCSRRDIEIHSKLTWVVTVLVLNVLGALIYFAFGPRRKASGEHRELADDAVPVTREGSSWNPILGENRMAEGEGLNPRDPEHTEPES